MPASPRPHALSPTAPRLVALALALCLPAALALGAHAEAPPAQAPTAQPPAVSEHRLPVDDTGRIELARLIDLFIHEAGSAVSLPADLSAGHLEVSGTHGPAIVLGLNLVLSSVGVSLTLNDAALTVRIDQARLADNVDRLEQLLRSVLGRGPAIYALERVQGSRSTGRPVVLVHGLDSGPERLAGAGRLLARQGYDVYLFRYPDDGGVERAAAALGPLLRDLHTRRGRPISLVTVSMGGLVARAYIELSPDFAGEVDRLIACAPPFAGSGLARYHFLHEIGETIHDMLGQGFDGFFLFDGLGQGARDLRPGSRVLRRLAEANRRQGVRYSIIAGNKSIVPPEAFETARAALAALREQVSDGQRVAFDLVSELVEEASRVSLGLGDGAVTLGSQTLAGVDDRVVLPVSHVETLAGDGSAGPVPALDEVLRRLAR